MSLPTICLYLLLLYLSTCTLCWCAYWWYSNLHVTASRHSPMPLNEQKGDARTTHTTENAAERRTDKSWDSGTTARRQRTANSTVARVLEKWMDLFPELISITKIRDDVVPDDVTKANYTNVILVDGNHIEGGELKATINAISNNKQRKSHGGDYFRAILRPDNSSHDGVRCHVADNTDGTYSVLCKLLWSGKSRLWVNLMHPSEGIYHLIRNTSGIKTKMGYTTVLTNSKGVEEKSTCALSFGGEYSSSQLCNYSHPRNGEPWFCIKPSSGECSITAWQSLVFPTTPITSDPAYKKFFDRKTNFDVEISRSGVEVDIATAKTSPTVGLPPCSTLKNIRYDTTEPDGWIEHGEWKSLTCKNSPFDANKAIACLRNVTLYIIGDSTMRLWYEFYQKYLDGKEYMENITHVWSRSRTLVDKKNNITIHYRAHGPPLRNPGPPRSRPWVADTLESIDRGGRDTIIFFNIGFHFEIFDPSVFIRRVKLIKTDFLKLLERIPGVRIFVKGLNTHTEIKHVIASDWLSYRFDRILKNVFEGIDGITFISMWDASAILKNPLIHPGGPQQEMYGGIFQSYICP